MKHKCYSVNMFNRNKIPEQFSQLDQPDNPDMINGLELQLHDVQRDIDEVNDKIEQSFIDVMSDRKSMHDHDTDAMSLTMKLQDLQKTRTELVLRIENIKINIARLALSDPTE